MIPTPDLSHIPRATFDKVYEPAEDTFALLDALEQDMDLIRSVAGPSRGGLCVEIGSGSGCVSAFLSSVIGGDGKAAYLCTDINADAAACTRATGRANKTHLEPILTPLLSSLLARCASPGRSLVDVLLFNPPYVPTSPEEEAAAQASAGIAGAWAGGEYGTRLLDSLIERCGGEVSEGSRGRGIETLLSPGGLFYLVTIRQNDPAGIVRRLQARGLEADIVLSRRAGGEHLQIVRARRTQAATA